MKKVIFTILFFGVLQFGFGQTAKVYDYMTIDLIRRDLKISSSLKETEIITFEKGDNVGYNRHNELLKKVGEYEAKGWEVFVVNTSIFPEQLWMLYSFILRKEKE